MQSSTQGMLVTAGSAGLSGAIVGLIIQAFAFKGIDLTPQTITYITIIITAIIGAIGHTMFKQNLLEDYIALHARILEMLKVNKQDVVPTLEDPSIVEMPHRVQGQL